MSEQKNETTKDWQVFGWQLSPEAKRWGADKIPCPYNIVGINWCAKEPEVFFWRVPDIFKPGNERYDLTSAKVCESNDEFTAAYMRATIELRALLVKKLREEKQPVA